MATKFIQLDTAAQMLGISPDELNAMRTRNEIRGFRDGATWKFKSDELERAGETLKENRSKPSSDAGEESDEGGESVLLSERELGGSDVIGGSTVIGASAGSDSADSDIELGGEGAASDVELVADSMIQGSDLTLAADSDVLGDAGSKAPADAEATDLGLQFEDLDASTVSSEPASSDAADKVTDEASGLSLAADSDVPLVSDSDLTITGQGEESGLDVDGGSAIDLGGEDDDLVLGGSGSGSDVMGAGDSGISLGDPADSGISLDVEPMELGGSVLGDESLVLGEDDIISLGDGADEGAATQLRTEDDFLLTPLEDSGGDESESGSQVIALDDAGLGYDQSTPTMLQTGDAGMAMLEEDLLDGPAMGATGGGAAALAGTPQLAPGVVMTQAVPEAPYSIWNVLGLFVCIVILCFGGMLMYDLVRQMWTWDGAHPYNSGMMDAIINLF